jgi:thymidylate kinase
MYECDPKEAIRRMQHKSTPSDYFENKPLSYFKQVAKGYNEAAKRYQSVIIDASQSIDEVHIQTMKHIDKLLSAKS